ncbi:MAG TPA: SDR family oxidoreductase [Kofleriaceae bacterium]|jgi:citronellol/citronellal dehydrogenase
MQPPAAESQRIFKRDLLHNATAVVTGGGSGIGLATAREMVQLGARVAICGRTAEKLETARAELAALSSPDHVIAMACDIREPAQVEAFVKHVVTAWGGVDILVNNAGGQFPSPAQMISPNGFLAVVKNNLVGTFHMCREVANQSMIKKGGRIINVTANVFRGFPGMSHTGAARAGVENLTMSLSVEWAQFGILVNAIAPGIIISSGTERYPKELVERQVKETPLKRAGTVEEVAAAIVFIASPAASFMTGTIMRLDGGQALWGNLWEIP